MRLMVPAALSRRTDVARVKSLIAWLAIVAAVALAVGLAQTSAGHSLLRGAGLYEEPEGYTSLAFTDPQSLPTRLSSNPARVRMSFAINNASADPRSYHWSIELERTGHDYRLAAGAVEVPAGNRASVVRSVKAYCVQGQARMTVKIAAPAESVDFLMACSSRKEAKH
jgi:hypothetical protein